MMKLINYSLFSFVILICSTCWPSKTFAQTIVLNDLSQLKNGNTTYVIKKSFDLNDKTLTIPYNCRLEFRGGSFSNGTIYGNNTTISAKKSQIFKNVTLLGHWINKQVFSEWLDFQDGNQFDNANNFKNLMLLCDSDVMTHLYMQKGVFYCSVVTGTSNIKVPSNVYWHNSATVCQLPSDSSKFSLVLIHKSDNVTIDGGVFVGDVQSHLGNTGEWGHGIKVAGATNIVLKRLVTREFWGDGIDLIEAEYVGAISAGQGPCEHITIDSVACLFNRRQGLSIEAAKDVLVKNSEFAYTGKHKITEPGCGIDIEPWCNNEEKILNIRLVNCYIHDNNPKRDLCLEPNLQYYGKRQNFSNPPSNRIEIKKCRIGKLYLNGAKAVTIDDSEIDEICHFSNGEKIRMNRCTIKRKNNIKARSGLTMRRCK